MKTYFILPIFNKEELIENVLEGITNSISGDYKVITILDGCTDQSESILYNFLYMNKLKDKFDILFMNDVHEITCLNYALAHIKLQDPDPEDLIITVQDDVIIQEKNLDIYLHNVWNHITDLGYLSLRLGCDLNSSNDTLIESNFVESEFGHWKQIGRKDFQMLNHYDFEETEIAIRSPAVTKWKRHAEVGFYDSALAPCGFDCHDFSIRMKIYGYKNGVLSIAFNSDVCWGSMRAKPKTKVNSIYGNIYEVNKRYLAHKHKKYFEIKK